MRLKGKPSRGAGSLVEYYLQIRALHVGAALASGALFVLRGLAMWAGSAAGMRAPVRYLSYAIDSVLLAAAVSLATMQHRVPFVDPWLTTKIGLVLLYVVLGSLALRRAPTVATRRMAFVAAVACFAILLAVARDRGAWFAG